MIALLYAALQRVTSSGRFVPAIDGLRFIAIAWVVLFHIRSYVIDRGGFAPNHIVDSAIAHGHNGVQLFFVISGFILGWPIAEHYLQGRPAPNVGRFYLRRLTRLEPPYLIALVAFYVLLMLRPEGDHRGLTIGFVTSIPYLHGLLAPDAPWVNIVIWSLEIEVQFYLLVPVIGHVFALPTPLRRTVLLVACVGFAAGSAFVPLGKATILAYAHYFLGGFLVADLRATQSFRAPEWLKAVLGICGFCGMIAIEREASTWSECLFALATITAVAAALSARPLTVMLSSRPLVAIGGMCYSIYLLHYPLISAVGRVWFPHVPRQGYAIAYGSMALIALPAVLVASTVYYVGIEKPCMRPDWPRRLIARFSSEHRGRDGASPS